MTIYAIAHDVLDYDASPSFYDNLTYGLNLWGNNLGTGGSGTFTFPSPVQVDCWVHFTRSHTANSLYGGSGGAGEFQLFSNTGQEILRLVRDETSNPYIRIYTSAGATFGDYYWNSITSAPVNDVNDYDIDFGFEGSDSLKLYINGGLAINITGHGHTSLNSYTIRNGDAGSSDDFSGEFLCADFVTIGCKVKSVPIGTPTTNDLTGTASLFTDRVNGATKASYIDDFMTTTTSGSKFVAPVSSYTKDTDKSIVGISLKNYANYTTGSPVQSLRQQLVIGGTTYNINSPSLTESLDLYKVEVETNPDTSTAWSESDIQGMSVGVEILT